MSTDSSNYLIGSVSALASVASGTGATLAGSAGLPKIVIDGATTPVPFWPGGLLFKVGDRVVVVRVGKELFALAARGAPAWQAVALDSQVAASVSNDNPRVTVVNGIVVWEGTIGPVSGSWTGSVVVIPATPVAARPNYTNDSASTCRINTGAAIGVYVSSGSGSVTANFGSASATQLNLAGLTGYVAAGYE